MTDDNIQAVASNALFACPNCGGVGGREVEVIRMAHHPSCDGGSMCGRLCPIPVQDLDIERCDVCHGSGQVDADVIAKCEANSTLHRGEPTNKGENHGNQL